MAHHHNPAFNAIYVAAGQEGKELELVTIGKRDSRKVYEAQGEIRTFVVLKDGRLMLGGNFKNIILLMPTDDDLYIECGVFETGANSTQQIILNAAEDKAYFRQSKPNKIVALQIAKFDPKMSLEMIE